MFAVIIIALFSPLLTAHTTDTLVLKGYVRSAVKTEITTQDEKVKIKSTSNSHEHYDVYVKAKKYAPNSTFTIDGNETIRMSIISK